MTATPTESTYNETCQLAAEAASLRYINDTIPGISRRRRGKGFSYYSPDGERISSATLLQRIRSLAIPPAWRNVWICPYEDGHLQATGIDNKNRKQYRYHSKWRAIRDASKFERLLEFGTCLPQLRARLDHDLAQRSLTRSRVLAALIRIMEKSYIRVGNAAYAQEHNTYGLTTLRKKHTNVDGSHIIFKFKGKNRTPWYIDVNDRKLARVVRQCEEIPGYQLFKYEDEEGNIHAVHSEDVNQYLKEITGLSITAKDFRTWAACKETFALLRTLPVPETSHAQKIAYNTAVKYVASLLGHTPTICKKSYIHPQIAETWKRGELAKWNADRDSQREDEELFLECWQSLLAAANS
ncbi:MAG: DNA topoisomerase IB [Pseudomonadota bacterium]